MKLKEFFRKEKTWCKEAAFRDEFGEITELPHASSYCLLGAMEKTGCCPKSAVATQISELFPGRLPPPRSDDVIWPSPLDEIITWFNDHTDTTFADVRQVLEAADV